ncbi:MAG: 2-hydroxy-3-oxopropionate reductase [Alphaproteobacteria bacterium UBA4588]|jgi:3-hydroxyisobutyrate dehydrogenase-like beta-hydroxyacid dehydrogenase|nr:MAG: 2-hydroxy-3-oxopropionate reductase [Alphaproteobacteria bacterium UBA4588]
MAKVGVIGLGDMGSGLAKNLIEAGFDVAGLDLSEERRAAFVKMGGTAVATPAALADDAEAVFIMVMNGGQVEAVLFGEDGVLETLSDDAAIILTATIKPQEGREIGARVIEAGKQIIDSPVSGGFPGAQGGSLTMMAAAPDALIAAKRHIMDAVSANIHHVGTNPGDGQSVKACLQSLIGSIFAATFEASTLAAKAGISGQVLYDVFSTSGAGCGVANTALGNIIDRKFHNTGSHISTMHKDLTIALGFGEELGVPLHTASTAMQLFHAGKTKYPDGDNWVVTRVLEEIVGAELHRMRG